MIPLTYTQPDKLTDADWAQVRQFCQQFVERDFDTFIEKLKAADEIFLSHTQSKEAIQAFGAVKIVTSQVGQRQVWFIYTLWSAIHPQARGNNLLQRAGIRYFLKYRFKHPLRPLYWLFTASTYTSYLLLLRNFADYWPHPSRPTPPPIANLVDQVMTELEADEWDAGTWVLVRRGASRYLEGVVADEDEAALPPEIQFYAQRNPHQLEGDSLVCLCPLTAKNWLFVVANWVRRLIRKIGRSG